MFEKEIRKFRELLHIGMSSMKEAAEIYVKVIDREPAAKQAFRELVPEVPSSAWKLMEKVGRGQMHERLLLMGGRIQTLLAALPLSEQTEVIENGLEVLLHDGNAMRIMPESLTQSQLSQVFGSGEIRSLEAQRAWMESRRDYRLPVRGVPEDAYKVEGALLVVNQPMSFRLAQLKDILRRMEAAGC